MATPNQASERDVDGYGLSPIHVSETCWLYGDASGLTVVQEDRDGSGKHIRTLQSVVPWDRIDKARERSK